MNDIEIIIKIVDLILTFIGLVFVIFGWIIPHRQSQKDEKKRRKFEEDFKQRQWKKELIDQQISRFYGPISVLLREQDIRFSLIQYQMGKTFIFSKDQYKLSDLSQDEQKIWKHFVDKYILPTNREIISILENNQHLIFKSEIPTSLSIFQNYVMGWELLYNQKREGVPNYYEYYYSINFPREFQNYINETLKTLLKIQSELLQLDEYPSTTF